MHCLRCFCCLLLIRELIGCLFCDITNACKHGVARAVQAVLCHACNGPPTSSKGYLDELKAGRKDRDDILLLMVKHLQVQKGGG